MRAIPIIALCGLLMACSDSPEALIVHRSEVIQVPAGLNTCPGETPLVKVESEADVAEVARINRSGYVECRNTVQRILDFLKQASGL